MDPFRRHLRRPRVLRPFGSILLLCLLAACADMPRSPSVPVEQEAAQYRAHARTYYAPPGPAFDPWGPYINEASRRFDVPDGWIRAVMQQESGGHEFINGQFVTSVPGAMGLMQLMPPTYDDMRMQYGLGTDPYEPHDNILAGAAYMRQMYDIYGSPGFLAAYNTGPGRLDDFLTRNRALPHETRQYVAIIGPRIAGIYPSSRSQADLMVMNHHSSDVVSPPVQSATETRSVRMAWARKRDHDAGEDQPVQVAEAPGPPAAPIPAATRRNHSSWTPLPPAPAYASAGPVRSARGEWASRLAAAPARPTLLARATEPDRASPDRASPDRASQAPTRHGRRFGLNEPAMAATPSVLRLPAGSTGPRDWAIQVGAFGTVGQASQAVGSARSRMRTLLPQARGEIAGIRSGRGAHVYRARLTGLSRDAAMQACQRLSRGRSECMVVSPESRS